MDNDIRLRVVIWTSIYSLLGNLYVDMVMLVNKLATSLEKSPGQSSMLFASTKSVLLHRESESDLSTSSFLSLYLPLTTVNYAMASRFLVSLHMIQELTKFKHQQLSTGDFSYLIRLALNGDHD